MNEEGGGASRSTEPAAGNSSATDVSLREHLTELIYASESRVNLRLNSIEDRVKAAFEASQLAIDKADTATEKRFEGVNEFRAALSDQASQFVTQGALQAASEKAEANYLRNREDIELLNTRMNLREGEQAGQRITTGVLVTITTVLIGVIGLIVVLANYISSH